MLYKNVPYKMILQRLKRNFSSVDDDLKCQSTEITPGHVYRRGAQLLRYPRLHRRFCLQFSKAGTDFIVGGRQESASLTMNEGLQMQFEGMNGTDDRRNVQFRE